MYKKSDHLMRNTDQAGNLALDLAAPTVFSEQRVLSLYGLPLAEPTISLAYQVVKRVLDVCGALFGLALLGMLLPLIAFLMQCEGRGPLFYKQTRAGRYGQAFTMYKLRSMIVDADNYFVLHPGLREAWQRKGKLHDDPRVTRLGRFLRRSSLDELPQLLNVLRGEMSLVGPRAIQYCEMDAFGELKELRQMVKPGLTGLWQVSGRSMTDYEQRCILDCTYVMECSLWMDIQILLKTLSIVFYHTGAY